MGLPSARITDFHVCPLVNPGPVPHVGGPIAAGCPTVLVGGIPAARVGDTAICTGPPDSIAIGAFTVLIGKAPAARITDTTVHGGKIVSGFPTVLIGDNGASVAPGSASAPPAPVAGLSRQANALITAEAEKKAFCRFCPS